jgi:hypothetical protein
MSGPHKVMTPIEWLVGDIVWIAGFGPMQILELPQQPRKTTITMLTPAGHQYWAGWEQFRTIDAKMMAEYIPELEQRIKLDPIEKKRLQGWLKQLEQKVQ